MIKLNELAAYCKKKGFVFQSSEIYEGSSGFFDYGPLGTELKLNIKNSWWQQFVREKENVVGIDGSLISPEKVWKASGHLESMSDPMVQDEITKQKYRADHIVENKLKKPMDGVSEKELMKLINENEILSPAGNMLVPCDPFNVMFPLQVGADVTKDSIYYLRGETAQIIFTAFKNVFDNSRLKLPFGIAQIGKAFRNEISPRSFLFRQREFEQMEIEFFVRDVEESCSLLKESENGKYLTTEFLFLSKEGQNKEEKEKKTTIRSLLKNKMLSQWHAYWLMESYFWLIKIGIKPENLRIREHTKNELSHYSSATFDIEYKFSFGFKEIHGNANRGSFDLTNHQKHSSKSMKIFDEETKKNVLAMVIEPSFGLDRTFLALISDAYHYDEKRGNIVLKLDKQISPYKVAIFPLHKKLEKKSREVYELIKKKRNSYYDRGGSIGRRYARADEIGVPYCITIDFETLENEIVTIRDRDTTKQEKVKIEDIEKKLNFYFS